MVQILQILLYFYLILNMLCLYVLGSARPVKHLKMFSSIFIYKKIN